MDRLSFARCALCMDGSMENDRITTTDKARFCLLKRASSVIRGIRRIPGGWSRLRTGAVV